MVGIRMKTGWMLVIVTIVCMAVPAQAHLQLQNDPNDTPGPFDIQRVTMRHGRGLCQIIGNCVSIGIKTFRKWSPGILGRGSRHRNFFVLFGRRKGWYDRYLWVWWKDGDLVATMKASNGDYGYPALDGRFLGSGNVLKQGNDLAVRFPMRLLWHVRGTTSNLTHRVWWQVVSEYRGQGCRKICWDFAPNHDIRHRF